MADGDPAADLVGIIKRKLKKIQYRPELIDGCLAETGLTMELTKISPSDTTSSPWLTVVC